MSSSTEAELRPNTSTNEESSTANNQKASTKAKTGRGRTIYFWGNLLLTVVVATIAARIEYLNIHAGSILPMTIKSPDGKWHVPSLEFTTKLVDFWIAKRRQETHARENPNTETPELETFMGPAYSAAEQTRLDREIDMNGRYHLLFSWVKFAGFLQLLLAPLTFLAALVGFFIHPRRSARWVSVSYAVVSLGAMFLLLLRDYSIAWH